jgi:hypothetical protein
MISAAIFNKQNKIVHSVVIMQRLGYQIPEKSRVIEPGQGKKIIFIHSACSMTRSPVTDPLEPFKLRFSIKSWSYPICCSAQLIEHHLEK